MAVAIGRTFDNDNPHMRIYHVRVQLADKPATMVVRNCVDPDTEPLAALVLDVPGVECAAVLPYSLVVIKAVMYDWAEIESALHGVLATFAIPIDQVMR